MAALPQLLKNLWSFKRHRRDSWSVLGGDLIEYYAELFKQGKYEEIFNRSALVAAIISKRVTPMENAHIYVTDRDNNDIQNSKARDLLERPNFYMTFGQWYMQKDLWRMIHGFCVTVLIRNRPGGYPVAMFNLPRWCFSATLKTNKIFRQTKLSEVMNIRINGLTPEELDIDVDNDLIIWNDTKIGFNPQNPYLAMSRMTAIQKEAELTRAIAEAELVVVQKRGAVGILSRDLAGATPGSAGMLADDKEAVQEQLREMGMNRKLLQIIVTTGSYKWQQMTWPTKELMLIELDQETAKKMCGVYDVPYYLIPLSGQSTYDNETRAEVKLYQDVVIPTGESDAKVLTKKLGDVNREIIKLDYTHLSVLQQDSAARASALSSVSGSVVSLTGANLIGVNEARSELAHYMDIDPKKDAN